MAAWKGIWKRVMIYAAVKVYNISQAQYKALFENFYQIARIPNYWIEYHDFEYPLFLLLYSNQLRIWGGGGGVMRPCHPPPPRDVRNRYTFNNAISNLYIYCSKVASKYMKCRFREPNFKNIPGGHAIHLLKVEAVKGDIWCPQQHGHIY